MHTAWSPLVYDERQLWLDRAVTVPVEIPLGHTACLVFFAAATSSGAVAEVELSHDQRNWHTLGHPYDVTVAGRTLVAGLVAAGCHLRVSVASPATSANLSDASGQPLEIHYRTRRQTPGLEAPSEGRPKPPPPSGPHDTD